MIALTLACIVLLLGLAVAGAFTALAPSGRGIVYGGSLAISVASLLIALLSLAAAPSTVTLPIGLPWTGAHFRLDPLAAFFLVVVGLGSAGASIYALGYGRHEHDPQRVLPFYPAFLAGLNLVVIADDAFSFLFAWELMSLASWALVMAHHREPRQRARRLCLHHHGELLRPRFAAVFRPACRSHRQLHFHRDACRPPVIRHRRAGAGAGADRRRIEGRRGAAACLAAAGASRRTQPRLRADERGDDQGRGVRLRPHRVRSAGSRQPGGPAPWSWRSAASPRCSACSTR